MIHNFLEKIYQFGRNIRYVWRVRIREIPSDIYFYSPIGVLIELQFDSIFRSVARDGRFDDFADWLDANVGKQGIYWKWRVCRYKVDIVELKILNKKKAVPFLLMI